MLYLSQSLRHRLHDNTARSYLLFIALLPLLLAISFLYPFNAGQLGVVEWAYLLLLHGGHFPKLIWLPLLLLLLAFFWLPARLFNVLSKLLTFLVLVVLLADALVYNLYRFHLNPMIFELILRSGRDTFEFSAALLATISFIILLLSICYWISIKYFFPRITLPVAYSVFSGSLVVLAGAHTMHAYQDAHYDTTIASMSRHAPLYYGMTAKRFMVKYGLVNPMEQRRFSQIGGYQGASELLYPQASMQCEPVPAPENILMIVIDSLRADTLTAEWMPNSWAFARSASRFNSHYSGGNSTLSGIFSLFYGLPANYWNAFYAEQRAPVLTKRLIALDYDMQIWSSATLVSPAFDRTVFSGVKDIRLKTPVEGSWRQDRMITDDWLAFTDRYDGQRPFFGFLFFSSVHGFSIRPDYPRIEPFWEDINQLALLLDDSKREPYHNVHRTAAHYVDSLIGEVLNDLRSRQLLNNTWVVITSDHGEEFNDLGQGYWGHGSNFSDVQLSVPMIIYQPGKTGTELSHRSTHHDVSATLMGRVLGCAETPATDYSVGMDIYDPARRQQFIASSYSDYAVVTEDTLVVARPDGRYTVMDKQLQPVDKELSAVFDGAELLKQLSRFYQ